MSTVLSPADLVLVLTVADEGSLTAAASRLSTSQPALSRSLRLIERRVGTELFERLPRGVRVTAAGRIAVEHARTVAAATQQAERHLSAHLAGVRTVAVGIVPELSVLPTARALAALALRDRGRLIAVRVGPRDDLVAALRLGELDAVIGPVPANLDGLAATPLFEVRHSLTVRPRHPVLAERGSDLHQALCRHPWIGPPTPSPLWQRVVETFRRFGVEPPAPQITTTDMPLTVTMVTESDVVSILPDDVTRIGVESGRLVRLDIDLGEPGRPVAVLRVRSESPHGAVDELFDVLVAALAGVGIEAG